MEDLPAADLDGKLPDLAPVYHSAKAAYTAETGSYMYMSPEVGHTVPCESQKRDDVRV